MHFVYVVSLLENGQGPREIKFDYYADMVQLTTGLDL